MRTLKVLVVVVGLSSPAAAQTEPATLAALRAVMTPGVLVIVTDGSGHDTRGIVRDVTDAALTLEGKVFPASTIHTVRQTDSLANGTLAGVAAGLGATFALAARCGRYEFSEQRGLCEAAAVTSALLVVPVAAFVGRAIDRAAGDRELYRRPHVARVSLAPVWRPAGAGVHLSVTFSRVP